MESISRANELRKVLRGLPASYGSDERQRLLAQMPPLWDEAERLAAEIVDRASCSARTPKPVPD